MNNFLSQFLQEDLFFISHKGQFQHLMEDYALGANITICCQYPLASPLPPRITYTTIAPQLTIGFNMAQGLQCIPKITTVGMGCRRGKSQEVLQEFLFAVLQKENISCKSIRKICSIDLKKDEEGLIQLAKTLDVPFETFSAQQLLEAKGSFSTSPFVQQTTGVDNVCERSAVLGSSGMLIVNKTVNDGMTVALATSPFVLMGELPDET